MHTIHLTSLALDSFLSFSAPQTVVFPTTPGLRFLTGRNEIEPHLGANGAGKSSLFEALAFCLYGSASDGDRASSLTSWGKKRPQVTARLLVGDREVAIQRLGAPNQIFIDNEPREQNDVNQLLGLGCTRFMQAVMFGQAARLFVDLGAPERGALMDEVLDLQLWLRASDAAADQEAAARRRAEQTLRELSRLQGVLTGLGDEAALQAASARWESDHRTACEAAIADLATAETRLDELAQAEQRARHALGQLVPGYNAQQHQRHANGRITTLAAEIAVTSDRMSQLRQLLTFYTTKTTCPTCHQPIDEQFRDAECAKLVADRNKLAALNKLREDERTQLQRQAEADHQVEQRALVQEVELKTALASAAAQYKAEQRTVDALVKRAEELVAQDQNPYADRLRQMQQTKQSTLLSISKTKVVLAGIENRVRIAAFWKQGFKRVRLFLVKRVLDSLAVEVGSAASSLGLHGWKLRFETETETKSGTLRHGIQVLIQSPQSPDAWQRFSGGEHQRIKLAVNLGLANMIQRLAGVRFGFAVFDEPTAGLSSEGIADLLDFLDRYAMQERKAVWLLDHRALDQTGFVETWCAVKDSDGSRIIKVAGEVT